ncbi:hypothetical protein ACFOPX_00020 [Helicobacter baculiformis]|uniref:Periplasmic competence protein n=1 Tax=Helicobacter baculiformis TaxID=427351 RepID=A0ABV7ZEC2_9HELI|nr:hypothetical protein [Helicobacter baculiformis]
MFFLPLRALVVQLIEDLDLNKRIGYFTAQVVLKNTPQKHLRVRGHYYIQYQRLFFNTLSVQKIPSVKGAKLPKPTPLPSLKASQELGTLKLKKIAKGTRIHFKESDPKKMATLLGVNYADYIAYKPESERLVMTGAQGAGGVATPQALGVHSKSQEPQSAQRHFSSLNSAGMHSLSPRSSRARSYARRTRSASSKRSRSTRSTSRSRTTRSSRSASASLRTPSTQTQSNLNPQVISDEGIERPSTQPIHANNTPQTPPQASFSLPQSAPSVSNFLPLPIPENLSLPPTYSPLPSNLQTPPVLRSEKASISPAEVSSAPTQSSLATSTQTLEPKTTLPKQDTPEASKTLTPLESPPLSEKLPAQDSLVQGAGMGAYQEVACGNWTYDDTKLQAYRPTIIKSLDKASGQYLDLSPCNFDHDQSSGKSGKITLAYTQLPDKIETLGPTKTLHTFKISKANYAQKLCYKAKTRQCLHIEPNTNQVWTSTYSTTTIKTTQTYQRPPQVGASAPTYYVREITDTKADRQTSIQDNGLNLSADFMKFVEVYEGQYLDDTIKNSPTYTEWKTHFVRPHQGTCAKYEIEELIKDKRVRPSIHNTRIVCVESGDYVLESETRL